MTYLPAELHQYPDLDARDTSLAPLSHLSTNTTAGSCFSHWSPHQSIRECMSDLPASWTTTTPCILFPQDPLYHLLPPISSCSPGQPFPTTVTDSIDSGILQISQIKRWVTCLPVELPTTQMLNPRAHPMVLPLSDHPSSFIGGQPGSRDHRKTPTQGC